MTTVLTCETEDFVALVSDRAVSYLGPDGRVAPSTDRTVKTIVLYGRFLVGVTGVGMLDGKPVDEWTVQALQSTDPRVWPRTLALETERALACLPWSWKSKGLTFAVVGIAPVQSRQLEVHHLVISNVRSPDGAICQPQRKVSIVRLPRLSKDEVRVRSYGVPPRPGGIEWAERALRRYGHRYPGQPQGAVQLFGRMVSGVSGFAPTVSSSCLVCVLPASASGTGNVDAVVGTDAYISADAVTCINYIGAEDQRWAYLPAFLSPDGAAIGVGGFIGPADERPPARFGNGPG